jgi:hypothetical protein
LAVDSSDAPIVAWAETIGSATQLLVRRWDGASWTTLGSGSLGDLGVAGDNPRRPALAAGRGGLVIAWEQDDPQGTNVHAARWDGVRWQSLDPGPSGISTSGRAQWPGVAVDSAGTVYLAWDEQLNASVVELYLRTLSL